MLFVSFYASFFQIKHVWRHFCSDFQGVCSAFKGVCKGFQRFCQDFTGFCPDINGFCPDFHQIKTFAGALSPPAPLPPTPVVGSRTISLSLHDKDKKWFCFGVACESCNTLATKWQYLYSWMDRWIGTNRSRCRKTHSWHHCEWNHGKKLSSQHEISKLAHQRLKHKFNFSRSFYSKRCYVPAYIF